MRTCPSRPPVAMRWYERPQDGAQETDVMEYEAGPVISFAIEGEPEVEAVKGSALVGGTGAPKPSGCEYACGIWGVLEVSVGGVGSRERIVVGRRDGVTWIILWHD
jgi:hypothetical protein